MDGITREKQTLTILAQLLLPSSHFYLHTKLHVTFFTFIRCIHESDTDHVSLNTCLSKSRVASIFLCLGAFWLSKLLSSKNSRRAIARSPGAINPGVRVEGGRV
jgi:hypothetical protein